MVFFATGVWIMEYQRFMGFWSKIAVHRVGGLIFIWGIRGYGLIEVCVKRGSTVYDNLS